MQNFLNKKASEQDTAVVFDLGGNFSFRFEQADGNMALPIWLGGKPHLLGKVGVCGEKPFKDLIAKLLPLLNTNTNQPKIVLPPILRYISGGCCQDATHAGNATEDNHAVTMIGQAQVARLRKVLRGELAGSALVNYWVLDILEDLAPTSAGGLAGVEESAFELINLFTGDNVHLTGVGYGRLAVSIPRGIDHVAKKRLESECVVTGELKNFYWRGFVSHKGSSRPKPTQNKLKMRGRGGWGGPGRGGHGGHRRHHNFPYS